MISKEFQLLHRWSTQNLLWRVGTIWGKSIFEATRTSCCAREGTRDQGVGLPSSLLRTCTDWLIPGWIPKYFKGWCIPTELLSGKLGVSRWGGAKTEDLRNNTTQVYEQDLPFLLLILFLIFLLLLFFHISLTSLSFFMNFSQLLSFPFLMVSSQQGIRVIPSFLPWIMLTVSIPLTGKLTDRIYFNQLLLKVKQCS